MPHGPRRLHRGVHGERRVRGRDPCRDGGQVRLDERAGVLERREPVRRAEIIHDPADDGRVGIPCRHWLVDVQHVDLVVPRPRVERRAVGVAVYRAREAARVVHARRAGAAADVDGEGGIGGVFARC